MESRPDNATVGRAVSWWSQGTTHRVARDHRAGEAHLFGNMSKGPNNHGDSWNTLRFGFSRYVSDRHMTDRSDGYQEERLDAFALP